ncbi:MAG TPA: ABC transporter permease [Gemmatimonadaceae bacterium]|nr:ABC transporter permease [Gemmatimonadaceae bacterium]
MSWHHRLRNLFRSDRLIRDIEREVEFHIAERAEALRVQGMPEDEALRQARLRFGNRTVVREQMRDADIVTWADSFAGDVRYVLRALRRAPAFAVVAVASLALGIGANTAIYSLIDAVVLRPLPVNDPHELVQLAMGEKDQGYFTNPLWEQVRDNQSGFTAIAAFGETTFNTAGGQKQSIGGSWVSGDYFTMFGVQPVLGRLFGRADDVRGCSGTAVLGNGYWHAEYGSRTDVVGRTISLEGKPFQIVGVAPAGFRGAEIGGDPQVYVPLCSEAVISGSLSALDRRSNWWLRVIGRRQSDLSLQQVKSRLAAISPEVMQATLPPRWSEDNKREYLTRTITARPGEGGVSALRKRYTTALATLMGGVGVVLLIACANVANLLMARAAAREREMAVRLAIGAGRRRLVRQLMTESGLLALCGAVVGLFVARWGTQGLVALISTSTDPVTLDLALSRHVLGFTALVAILTAMVFGLVPAWRATRVSPQAAMKPTSRGVAEGHSRFTIGKTLVVIQVALSLTLLVGAGLLFGSLRNLVTLDPGFQPRGILVTGVNLRRTGIPAERYPAAHREILEQLRAIPGVRSASTSQITPIGHSTWNDMLLVDGFHASSQADAVVWFNSVSEGYFATLGTKLLAGRDFDHTDVPRGAKSAIITEELARKFFGSVAPLGRQFRTKAGDGLSEPLTVVGVVQNAKYESLRETSSPTVYLAATQDTVPGAFVALELRAAGEPQSLVPSLKRVFAATYPAATLEFRVLDEQISESLRRERLLAVLSGLFGAVAVLLSMLGLYGVMAYSVARRRNEIGVRIALGADRMRVLRMVLGDVARVVAIGLALGVAGALVSGRLVATFLFGVAPADPTVLTVSAAGLSLVALAAGLIPALRASRMDPAETLREE